MSESSLQISEQALRLALAVLALALAAGLGASRIDPTSPRPGIVQEW